MKIKALLLAAALLTINYHLFSQLPADLSKVRSSQITDIQLSQVIQRAQSSGQTREEIISELKQRGLPETELAALNERINSLLMTTESEAPQDKGSTTSKGNRSSTVKMPEVLQADKKSNKIFT